MTFIQNEEKIKKFSLVITLAVLLGHFAFPAVTASAEPMIFIHTQYQTARRLSPIAISSANLLIIGGTSLAVYPAANFLRYFIDENIVLINRDETQIDSRATLVFRENIGDVLSDVVERYNK